MRDGIVRANNRTVIRVNPTVIAGTTEDNDVMFDNVEIPNAVIDNGGCSKLLAVYVIDIDNENHDMDLIFMSTNTALGTAGSAANISDADALATNMCGVISLDFTDRQCSLGGSTITGFSNVHGDHGSSVPPSPMLLQAEAGSTSVFMGAIVREEAAYEATNNLQIILHIEY